MFNLKYSVLLGIGVFLGGCSSIQSTVVRNPESGAKGDGIPVVVQRPRYLRVTERQIDKRLVLSDSSGQVTSKSNPGVETGIENTSSSGSVKLTSDATIYTTNTVEYEVVTVGEVYLVDVRRPAAGTADFTFEFDPGTQYPKKLTAKTEDKTIESVGSALGSLIEKAGKVFKPTSGTLALPAGATTIDVASRITKVSLYDLDRLSDPTYSPVVLFAASTSGISK